MTHNELRDYIDKFDAAGMVKEPMVAALRAVVELHYPTEGDCARCITVVNNYVDREIYPCKTIQTIEKELA